MVPYIALFFLLVSADQVLKFLVRQFLTSSSYVEVIPNFIHLTYQENKGISFSMLSNLPEKLRVPLLIVVTALVVFGFVVYVFKQWRLLSRLEKLGYTIIISGAVGNLIDRAFRQQVTDYMHFHIFDFGLFVNNLADDLVFIGFALVIIHLLKNSGSSKNEKKPKA